MTLVAFPVMEVQEIRRPSVLELFCDYGDGVYALAVRMLGSTSNAEDVVQDTFMMALRKLDTFRGDGPIAAWLYRIAYRQAITVLRRLRDDPTDPVALPERTSPASVEAQVLNTELAAKLDEAIGRLAPLLRAAFVLRDVEELSTKETAHALEVTEPAVKMRLNRARQQLRSELGGYL